MIYFWLLMTGLVAGVLAGMFGLGGGIIIVPILVLGFKLSQQSASGTSLVSLLMPVGILGVVSYYRAGRIDSTNIKWGLVIALGIFVGSYFGSRVAMGMSELYLRRAFAMLLAVMAVRVFFAK